MRRSLLGVVASFGSSGSVRHAPAAASRVTTFPASTAAVPSVLRLLSSRSRIEIYTRDWHYRKPVEGRQFGVEGPWVQYDSISHAASALGLNQSNVSQVGIRTLAFVPGLQDAALDMRPACRRPPRSCRHRHYPR